jgi:hypothetical protein
LTVEEDIDMPRFEKGNRFSTGRPRGARNKSTVWLDELGREGTEKVICTVKKEAEQGDMRAASILLARTWPHRRGRPVTFDLPTVETTGGIVQAQAVVIAAMARGELTPDEAQSVANVLELQRRAIQMHDHEQRLQALEAKKEKEERPGLWEATS